MRLRANGWTKKRVNEWRWRWWKNNSAKYRAKQWKKCKKEKEEENTAKQNQCKKRQPMRRNSNPFQTSSPLCIYFFNVLYKCDSMYHAKCDTLHRARMNLLTQSYSYSKILSVRLDSALLCSVFFSICFIFYFSSIIHISTLDVEGWQRKTIVHMKNRYTCILRDKYHRFESKIRQLIENKQKWKLS